MPQRRDPDRHPLRAERRWHEARELGQRVEHSRTGLRGTGGRLSGIGSGPAASRKRFVVG